MPKSFQGENRLNTARRGSHPHKERVSQSEREMRDGKSSVLGCSRVAVVITSGSASLSRVAGDSSV